MVRRREKENDRKKRVTTRHDTPRNNNKQAKRTEAKQTNSTSRLPSSSYRTNSNQQYDDCIRFDIRREDCPCGVHIYFRYVHYSREIAFGLLRSYEPAAVPRDDNDSCRATTQLPLFVV